MGKFLRGGVRRLHYIYVTCLFVKCFTQTSVFLDNNNNNNNNNNKNIKKVSERASMTEIQKICMLGSARILRKVLSV